MMHAIKVLHVSLIWDMLSHACALSGPDSFSNHIQNAQYDYKTKLRVATNLENMENLENSGNLKSCQNLRENSGNLDFFVGETWKTQGK